MSWWEYRRRRWIAVFIAAVVLLIGVKLLTPSSAGLVIYNEGQETIGPVRITIGTEQIDFPRLAAGASQVWNLNTQHEGELRVWLDGGPTDGVIGPWVDVDELSQVVVRIDHWNNVLFSVSPSWGERLKSWLP